MIRYNRASLAVIALGLLGVQSALAAPTITSQPRDKFGNTATILDVHENCEVDLRIVATGVGTLSYQWRKGTTNVDHPSATSANLRILPSTLAHAGEYNCVVTDSADNVKVTSSGIKVAAVDIRSSAVLAAVGQTGAALTVQATPTLASAGLSFRWYRKGVGGAPDTKLLASMTKYSGVTSRTLTVRNIAPGDAAQFYCKVFAYGFSMNGGNVNLGVIPAPASTSLGVGSTLNLNIAPIFPAEAGAYDSLSFQWRKGTSNLADPSAITADLSLADVDLTDSGAYNVIVGGVFNNKAVTPVTSPSADVFVVNNAPGKLLAAAGSSPKIAFEPTNDDSTYQWYSLDGSVETLLANGADYAGATTDELTVKVVNTDDAISYFCKVTTHGQTVNGGVTDLIVIPAPASVTVGEGDTAELTVNPAGADAATIAAMTFQWKKGTAVVGTEQTLSIPNVSAANVGDYVCIVSLAGAGTATSPKATILVVDTTPGKILALAGTDPKLAVIASASTTQTFQWFKVGTGGAPDVPLLDLVKFEGADSKTLEIQDAVAADAGDYYCNVTTFGITAKSGIRTLAVIPTPASRTVLEGQPLTLQVMPAGLPLGEFTFQWTKGGAPIGGANADIFTIPAAALTDAGKFSCIVGLSGAVPASLESLDASVIVVGSAPYTKLGVTAKDQSLEVVTAPAMGAAFQWFRVGSPDVALSNGPSYTGVTTKKLTVELANAADAGEYRCRVTAFGETVEAPISTLVLLPPPASELAILGYQTQIELMPVGASPAMMATMTFQWRKGTADVAGATTATLTLPDTQLIDSGSYLCRVTLPGAVPETLDSLKATLNVVDPAPVTKMVAQGTDATFAVVVKGMGNAFKWFKRDGATVTELVESTTFVGTTKSSLKVNDATLAEAGIYFCRVTTYGQTVEAGDNRLIVVQRPANQDLLRGEDLLLTVTVAGAATTPEFQWFKGTQMLPGEIYTAYSKMNAQVSDAGDYKCRVTVAGVGPLTTATTKVTVKRVTSAPDVLALNFPTGIVGGSFSYQTPIDLDIHKEPTEYLMSGQPKGLVIDKLTGLVSGRPTVSGSFSVTITAGNGLGNDSSTATLVVNALPSHLAGRYAGLLPRHSLNGGLGGSFEMTVHSTGLATGKLILGTTSVSFTGPTITLDVQGTDPATATATADWTVKRMGTLSPLILSFEIGTNNLLVDGNVVDSADAGQSFAFDGWRDSFDGASSLATEYQGYYTFAIDLTSGVGDPFVPQGNGIGYFTVDASGEVTIKGSTADDVDYEVKTFIGPQGQIAFFELLYTPKGSLRMALEIDEQAVGNADNRLIGVGNWSRPATVSGTNRVYRAGYPVVDVAVVGGRYDAPVAPARILGTSAADNDTALSFTDLGVADTNPNVDVFINVGNTVTIAATNPGLVKVSTTAADATKMANTGLFKGEFTLADDNPVTPAVNANELTRKAPFYGIIYPDSGVLKGAGYFILADLPSNGPPPTTAANSPLRSGAVYWDKKP